MFLDTCQDGTDQTERGGLEIGRKRKGRYLFLNKRISFIKIILLFFGVDKGVTLTPTYPHVH